MPNLKTDSDDLASIERDEQGYCVFRVPVDDRTVAWLCALAEMHKQPPALIAAAVLRDVRQDDEDEEVVRPIGTSTH